jgi:putative FmdB family regulatory protein
MPIYEYECEQCGVRFEKLQRMTEESLTECPECSGHIHRVMQPVGVIFKGSGFYVTDNKGKSSTNIPANKKDEEGKTAPATESVSASDDSKAKPATKAESASTNTTTKSNGGEN